MAGPLVVDTGAFVALIDRSEKRHAACVAVLERWRGDIVTTEPVLTETLYLVGPKWRAQKVCLEFFLRGAFHLVPSSRATLQRVATLIEQYQDLPMDFADATLVALAEDLRVDQIFTLDRRAFSIYRPGGRKPFRIVP